MFKPHYTQLRPIKDTGAKKNPSWSSIRKFCNFGWCIRDMLSPFRQQLATSNTTPISRFRPTDSILRITNLTWIDATTMEELQNYENT